jgi:hypothetical protein
VKTLAPEELRVVTIIDVNLIKIIETWLYASSEDPRRSFGPDVSISLQPGKRTVPFPIGRGTERSFSDGPLLLQQGWGSRASRLNRRSKPIG